MPPFDSRDCSRLSPLSIDLEDKDKEGKTASDRRKEDLKETGVLRLVSKDQWSEAGL
jgi:hypothetical protein